jgi:hypothetical protein
VHGHGAVVQGNRHAEGDEHALADRLGDVLTAVDDDGELVAADARDHVAGSHAAAQSFGEDEQELVAGGVAAAVVDALEVVEVDEEHAHRAAAAQHPVGDLLEQRAVGQPGERVAEDLVLVQAPGGQVREARAQDERAVDAGPHPGVVRPVVAEDRVRVQRADDAVVGDDHDQGDAVGHPVLVQRDHADHDEEDEVRLRDALPQVHEGGRGRHQADGRRRGLALAAELGKDRERDRAGDRHQDADGGGLAVATDPGEQHQGRGGGQAQPHDRAVAALPDGLGQQATLGEQAHGPVPELGDHPRRIGSFRNFLESDVPGYLRRGRRRDISAGRARRGGIRHRS